MIKLLHGSSDPNGAYTAEVGSIYVQIVAGNFVRKWIKVAGDDNEGWE